MKHTNCSLCGKPIHDELVRRSLFPGRNFHQKCYDKVMKQYQQGKTIFNFMEGSQ